jgi:hypothetical protein
VVKKERHRKSKKEREKLNIISMLYNIDVRIPKHVLTVKKYMIILRIIYTILHVLAWVSHLQADSILSCMFWLGLAIFRQILTQTNVYKHKRTLLLKYST